MGRMCRAIALVALSTWAGGAGAGQLMTSGLFAELREPDVYADDAFAPVPMRYEPFLEIDHRIGWYAGIARDGVDGSRFALLRYDNRGDPEACRRG